MTNDTPMTGYVPFVEDGILGDLPYAIRENQLGYLNGYLAVPPKHPWFGVDNDDINAEVHGGLTYSSFDLGLDNITYNVELWWVGFDCGHYFDAPSPGFIMSKPAGERHFYQPFIPDAMYRDRDYVYAQICRLAEQAHAAILQLPQPRPAGIDDGLANGL